MDQVLERGTVELIHRHLVPRVNGNDGGGCLGHGGGEVVEFEPVEEEEEEVRGGGGRKRKGRWKEEEEG